MVEKTKVIKPKGREKGDNTALTSHRKTSLALTQQK